MNLFESILRRIGLTPTEAISGICRREVPGRGAQKRPNRGVYLFPLTLSEFTAEPVTRYGDWNTREVSVHSGYEIATAANFSQVIDPNLRVARIWIVHTSTAGLADIADAT